MGALRDGFTLAFEAIGAGVRPDPDISVDRWADRHMVLPAGKAAEPGPYRTDRTPYAREIMRRLSPADPTQRVVVMGPSQLLKTQVGLNWLGAIIHMAPANVLALMPTNNLAKRLSARISDTIALVPALRERVAAPRSRDSRNTLDCKEFAGGALFITSAGSAANLAEIPARYVLGDEVDRWEANVGEEGDPVELAEARTSTFEYNRKIYLVSSPTIEGLSRIETLYEAGDKRRYWIACPHCDEHQVLEWEIFVTGPDGQKARAGVHWDDDEQPRAAWYVCPHCGGIIEEKDKARFLLDREAGGTAEWRPEQMGDGQTASYHLNALLAPLGFVSWLSLVRQFLKARRSLQQGDSEPMKVFYNTRLAKSWDASTTVAKADDLKARAEDYPLGIVPKGGLVLTASVDTQPSRLEVEIKAWGEGLENWVIAYRVLWGDPTQDQVWRDLDALLNTPILNHLGLPMRIVATCIDSGGHNTGDVYSYCRNRKHRNIIAIKGRAQSSNVIAGKPSKQDLNWRGTHIADGVQLWIVGTNIAKDWIHDRLKLTHGPGAAHFSKHLPDEYFDQLTAERKVIRYVKGFARAEWVKRPGDRNESLDTFVYGLAAAHFLGLHAYTAADWQKVRERVEPNQMDLLAVPPVLPKPSDIPNAPALEGEVAPSVTAATEDAPAEATQPPQSPAPTLPAPHPSPAPRPLLVRRTSRSSYLAR